MINIRKNSNAPAILVLADGSIFHGYAIGSHGITSGEVVFNTAMTGYQEIMTDPSYYRQIVMLTYPHIGNTGCNSEDMESAKNYAAGLIIHDLPNLYSNWRSSEDLCSYLKRNNVVAIAGIDTRKLTKLLREKGAQAGCILAGEIDEKKALAMAQAFPGLAGMDLAKVVSTEKNYQWNCNDGVWKLNKDKQSKDQNKDQSKDQSNNKNIVAYDFGIKHNILRMLAERGANITVVPAKTPAEAVLQMNPDGVFLSNGPGDPEPCDYAIKAIRVFLDKKIPVFGICLGHQLLALASGAKTIKMKFGHHGANHPVQDLQSKKVWITSQNHGFAVDENSMPENLKITHKSLFDGSIQGIERTDCPAFSFQGHPEASPGPHDADSLFDKFFAMMNK